MPKLQVGRRSLKHPLRSLTDRGTARALVQAAVSAQVGGDTAEPYGGR